MKICLTCEGISATEREQCGTCGTPLLPTDSVHYPLRRGEEDSVHPLLGSRLDGKFRITGVLGRGGMGTVFRGIHEVSLVPVALKLLHPRYGARADYREAFLAEARKAGRVVHDHCARILDVGEAEDGTIYIAMELAEGETLEEWILGDPPLTPPLTVEILVQICRALVAAHAAGLVHRDLSTRNVMVSVRDGEPFVKILDFGIAKAAAAVAREDARDLTGEPAGFANPAYSAPEHLEGRTVDARADLYSLGVIAYQALTGKLPVAGVDARETAQNTMAGRLKPLPALPGVPRRLQRLVHRLLAKTPEDRPPDAEWVLRELEAIRARGRSRLVRSAPLALLVSLAMVVVVGVSGREPFLTFTAGSSDLELAAALPRSAPALHLRSQELEELHFLFGGFRPTSLRAELYRDGVPLRRPRLLDPAVDADSGSLTLSVAQPAWGEVVQGLRDACRQGRPVDLQFAVPGRALLGAARLLVDDQPPELDCRLPDTEGGDLVIRGTTDLECEVRDQGGLRSLAARLAFEAPPAGGPSDLSVDLPPQGGRIALGDLLAQLLPGAVDLGPGTLVISARDAAGNPGEWKTRFSGCDPAAPGIRDVVSATGSGHVVFYGVPRVALRVQLSEPEAGLSLAVIDPDLKEQLFDSDDLSVNGSWLTVQLAGRAGEASAFANGVYEFRLSDAAGNVSRKEVQLFFRSQRAEPELARSASSAGRLVILGGELLVTDGSPCAVRFTCSDVYRPRAGTVRSEGGTTAVRTEPMRLEQVRPGAATLYLPALDPGGYRLQLQLEDATGTAPQATVPIDYGLRVLPPRVTLRLPDADARFLPALIGAGLLRWQDPEQERVLLEGFNWTLEPPDARLVRGRAWLGDLADRPLSERSLPGDPILPPFVPINGANVLGLELEDVLGRPVAVTLADEPAPPFAAAGENAVLIARFWHHDEAPVPVDPIVRLEHGQDSRLSVHSPLPFSHADLESIHLSLGQTEVTPEVVRTAADGGCIVEFVLPFVNLVGAANLDLPPEQYGRGEERPLRPSFTTPAGRSELELTVRTSRSTLAPVALADVAEGPLPEVLADIGLIPVLAPEGAFVDPVPENLPGRALFRAQVPVDVRGMQDFFLQDREITRQHYAAILETWSELPAGQRPDWRRLVHADDPLGRGRLEPAALVPAWLRGDLARWQELVVEAPDRPACGVDFYQAWTATRILGVLLGGDPDILRLPLGCELELAALGASGARTELVLNGPGGAGEGVELALFLAWSGGGDLDHPGDTAQWKMRDAVSSRWGRPFYGLDFGVREWVADLSHTTGPGGEVVLEWLGQQDRHLEKIREFAMGQGPREPAGRLKTMGVLRGLAAGEAAGLVDTAVGGPLVLDELERLPAHVPGVVRTEHLRRDGRDLTPGDFDPRLRHAGFRVAGGQEFVRRTRER